MNDLLGSWMPILLAVIAIVLSTFAMLEARRTHRGLRAQDRTLGKLSDTVARLQVGREPQPVWKTESAVIPAATALQSVETSEAKPSSMPKLAGAADVQAMLTTRSDEIAVGSSEAQRVPELQSPQYSPELVAELYQVWCRDRARPKATENIEIGSLQYDGQSEGSEGRTRHRLKDASQLAEFVRFSRPGATSAVVLPDPDAHFTPVVAYLFPGLTRADYGQGGRLCEQSPVTVQRSSPSQWEVL